MRRGRALRPRLEHGGTALAGNEGEIDPGAIWIPGLNADELEATASDLVGDGETMAESGNDIKSAWQGLQEVYAAPESETLFTAVDPVAADGDDIQDALATVGDALTTFAQEAKQIKQNLVALKGDAKTFLESIDGDDDWREDEEKVEEHEALRIDINHQIRNYQEAERNCANKITGIFGGTTFIGADPGKPTVCKPNERVYGVNYIPEEAATPWGAPQEVDEPFWMEALQGLGNIAAGVAEGVGVYGPNVVGDMGLVYPLSPQWFSNMGDQLKDSAAFAGSLTGFYDYKTGELGVGSPYEWAENFYPAWIEVGHAFVPWRESDRPGYVFSQAAFNFGTLGVGAALKFGRLGRLGAGTPPPEAPATDPMKHVPNPTAPAHAGNPDNPVEAPSVQQLHEQLDEMASLTEKGYSPTDAMEIVAGIPMREHAMAGGPDIQANADGPDDPNSSPPTTEPTVDAVDASRYPISDSASDPVGPGSDGAPLSGGTDPHHSQGPVFTQNDEPTEHTDIKSVEEDTESGLEAVPEAQNVDFDKENSTPGSEPALGKRIKGGHTDPSGKYMDKHGNVYVAEPDTLESLKGYETIRKMEHDTHRISANTGIDHDLLVRVKDHLFYRVHDVQIRPNQTNRGLFSPNADISPLWLAAQSGEMSEREVEVFRRTIMHEGVESYLMEAGLPYIPSDSSYFNSGSASNPTAEHHGAHDLAPSAEPTGDPFDHYWRMEKEVPTIELNDDLSNIDALAEQLLKEWNENRDAR